MAILALLLAAGAAVADQVIKLLVVQFLKPIGIQTLIPGFLSLDYLENRGAAFGIFPNKQWIIALLTAVICVLIVVMMFRYHKHNALSWTACTLILGGGVGNIIDRFARGYVVDYIHFHFFPYIFNFADICVVIGVALLILYLIFSDREEAKKVENGNA
ncbi:MAG: signal peptidase II [Oscillospiraceae bacterium]|nr:signal peptidase II [Oscillospiraceae bacterium]